MYGAGYVSFEDKIAAQFDLKSENCRLYDFGKIAYLFCCEVRTFCSVNLSPVCLCMFFCPEEDTLFSERFDNAGFLQRVQIHIRDKNYRIGTGFPHVAIEFTVDLDCQGLKRVCALCPDNHR